jgi:hypothetical protein
VPVENEKTNHEIPLAIANATAQPCPKVDSEELKNGNKPSENDDSTLQAFHASGEIEKEAAFYQTLSSEVLEDNEAENGVRTKARKVAYPV